MRTYFIETWGCQMNVHDSEHLEGRLKNLGLKPAQRAENADLVLLNTCSVREKPVQKIISRIGVISKFKTPPTIAVCGCVAQQEGEKLLKKSKHVGFILGPSQIGRVGEAIHALNSGTRSVITGFNDAADNNYETIFRKSSTRGMVTVIEGCNEYCTFCIVPYTRGREASRTVASIENEVRFLVSSGLKEIELLGQTINAYRCPETDTDFADLLALLATVPGLERLRYITSHPRHFTDELIEVLARYDNISKYLHLPFQAGSDRILKAMHRRYTRAEYIDLIGRIRGAAPGINLSTDVIVGFPGETEDDFLETMSLLKEIRFGQVFAFAYSPREKTPAALYEQSVSEADKKNRLHRLFELTDQISSEVNHELIGREMNVLIDGESRKSNSDWQGRAEDNRVVNFPKVGRHEVGDIVKVVISRAPAHSLAGEMKNSGNSLPMHMMQT